jgi:hypothetical protein
MKLWISGLIGILAILAVWVPRPVASEASAIQPQVINAEYLSPDPSYGHWTAACRDPHYRRHHRFQCWLRG